MRTQLTKVQIEISVRGRRTEARCGDMLKQAEFDGQSCRLFTDCILFANIFMHTLKYGILNLNLSDNIAR